jgi:hypothetical protein
VWPPDSRYSVHRKKKVGDFPSPAGLSLTKLSLAERRKKH